MGGWISSIANWISGKREVRVLILGLDSAGKTTILKFLSLGTPVTTTTPTVAFTLETVEVGKLRLQIWDLGGQRDLRPFWRLYYRKTDGVVFVIDSADRDRMELCKQELIALLGEDELRDVPLVIMANKQDLDGTMDAKEVHQRLGLSAIKDRKWNIFATSGIQGAGVAETFNWLSEQLETVHGQN
jgi:small GTP-binding protein